VGRRAHVDARLIEELANGATLEQAAVKARCSLATAKRRNADPEFRARVQARQEQDRRQRQAFRWDLWFGGEKVAGHSIRRLHEILDSPTASDRDKIRAGAVLLRTFAPKQEPPQPYVPSVADERRAAAFQASLAADLEVLAGLAALTPNQQRQLSQRLAEEGIPVPPEAAEVLNAGIARPDPERAPHGEVWTPPIPGRAPVQDRTPEPEPEPEPEVEEAPEPEPVQDWTPEPPPEPIPFRRPAPRGVEALDAEFERRMRGR
jgi:hypothetical protein